ADSLILLPYSSKESFNSQNVQMASQEISKQEANLNVLKSALKPDFNVGYSAQNYFDGGWLHGLQAGVELPLFNKQSKQKIEAQKLQIEVGKAVVEAEKLQFQQELLSIDNALKLYEAGVLYYQEQLELITPEIERISQLNYKAGEISYLELLNTLTISAKNNMGYWDQVLAYNKTVVVYQFFNN
ncbi:MAG: TolC family protein, partial [Bacteroidia bacterium]|nr:TolC family protein [Bacteroidia bacterium]